jgi:HAD superfamily hydrolase (TIGR01509 family)
MAVNAVIFDCDGTLVDSEPLGLEVLLRESRALGAHWASDADVLVLKGRPMAAALREIEQRIGHPLPPGFEDAVRLAMAEAFRDRLAPIPDAASALAALHVPYCVASNGPRHKIELTLGLTGLLPLFQGRVFSAYDVGSWKPDPGLFLYAANEMGAEPAQCVVVEDSESGVRAGLAAGMSVYLLRSAQPLPTDLAAHVHMLESLSDIALAPWNKPRMGAT